jgi:lipopolysaccharide export system permease protein
MDDDSNPIQVVHAAEGSLETDAANKQILLHMHKVWFEKRNADDPAELSKIQQGITVDEMTLPISLQELYEKNKKKKGMSSMTVQELIERLNSQESDTPEKRLQVHVNAMTEVSKRFSFSLASFAFVLIGIPLAITAHRKETSVGFMISLIVAFVYFCFILVADAMRSHPQMHPEWLVWSPNFLFITIGGLLFYRLSRR